MGRNTLKTRIRKDFVTGDDGYKFYWPSRAGGFESHTLRLIADLLDEDNKEWDEQLNKDLTFRENVV